MIFDSNRIARLENWVDLQFSSPHELAGSGLWVGVLSSGQCALGGESPQPAGAGSLLLGEGPLRLVPARNCHLVAARLGGSAAQGFLQGLAEPMFAEGASAPGAAGLLAQLGLAAQATQSALCFQLICEVANADAARPTLPPLVAQAIAAMHENYAGLYGVEELSASLGVSKSHLVRAFKAQLGLPPGQYLTGVRIEAAKQFLCHREYPLDVVASLCGFSGANYLCRVFKKVTGQTPASWRATAGGLPATLAPTGPLPLEKELYI